jgi:hypothetical protein
VSRPDLKGLTFRVHWSEPDWEYVGLCDQFPSMSWLSTNPLAALMGIYNAVVDVWDDLEPWERELLS